MRQILAIADDLTGAAEIAGIGWRFGLSVQLERDALAPSDADLLVIDTDTRSLTAQNASKRLAKLAPFLSEAITTRRHVFKKTDSILRGNPRAEIEALLDMGNYAYCVFLPQNPTLGRIVRDGKYFISEHPLHETHFASDPEHPATTNDVLTLFKGGRHAARYVEIADQWRLDSEPPATILGGAASVDHLNAWSQRIDDNTLPAGGGDFFSTLLGTQWHRPTSSPEASTRLHGNLLIVRGTAVGRAAYEQNLGIPDDATRPMPDELFDALVRQSWNDVIPKNLVALMDCWESEICRCLDAYKAAAISVDRPPVVSSVPGLPQRILALLAQVTASVIAARKIDSLLIEGGATAGALMHRCDWKKLTVLGELATGVIRLKPAGLGMPDVIIKPGSYPMPICQRS